MPRADGGVPPLPRSFRGAVAAAGALIAAAALAAWRAHRRRREPFSLRAAPIDRSGTDAVKHHAGLLDALYGEGASACIPMWVADMDLPCAPQIAAAVRRRAAHGVYGYTVQPEEMWDAVRSWLGRRHGWHVPRDALVFAPSAVAAACNVVRALTRPGDGVLVFTPLYAPLQDIVHGEGRTLVAHHLRLAEGTVEIDWPVLRAQLGAGGEGVPRVRLLILCSPHNPSGRVWRRAELHALLRLCAAHGVPLLSDELHADLTHGTHAHTPAALAASELPAREQPSVLTVSGPGKAFNTAGLHAAFLVLPRELERRAYLAAVEHHHGTFGNAFASAALRAAYAEEGGGTDAWLRALLPFMRANLEHGARALERRAPPGLFRAAVPDAGFLLWVDCAGLCAAHGLDGRVALRRWFIERARVLPSFGDEFAPRGSAAAPSPWPCEAFVRLNVACARATLDEALARICDAAADAGQGSAR